MVELRTAIEVLESGARYLKFQQDDGTNRYVRENEDGTTEQINRFAFSGGNRGRSRRLVDSGEFVEQQFEQPDGDIYSRIPDGDGGYNYFRNGSEIKGQAYAGASSNIERYRINDSDSNVGIREKDGDTFTRKDIYTFDLPKVEVCNDVMPVFNNIVEPEIEDGFNFYINPVNTYDEFRAILKITVMDRGQEREFSLPSVYLPVDPSGKATAKSLIRDKMRSRIPDLCQNYGKVKLDELVLIGRVF